MKFKLNTLAKCLFVSAAVLTSASALAEDVKQETEIIMIKQESGDSMANVSIDTNGEVIKLDVPFDAIHDKEKLKAAIADLPQEQQDLILMAMNKTPHVEHMTSGGHKVIQVDIESDGEHHWVSADGEVDQDVKVIKKVISLNGESDAMFIHADGDGDHLGDAVIHMIKKGSFTPEQLDQIQAALDSKR
ncbi:hypothetical protein [Thalassotalea crassostreae]|uniref:hypothetical protein n=1 Tax=Thalassotalea crassostreae TaxID=1763536 RepID=UPI0008385E3E|nr:hypothetical protein [Thalassotalea crassostreae]